MGYKRRSSPTPGEDHATDIGELFDRHGQAIHAYCRKRTGDAALAEDLTAIVFLEAWRNRARIEASATPALPWLYGVATNVLRNQRRAHRRWQAALDRMPPPLPQPDIADGVAQRLDAQDEIRAAFRQLPKREQDVVALCLWSGLTYEDAATALGVPVGTVRSRLARARARIRKQLLGSSLDPDRAAAATPLALQPADGGE